MRLGYHRLKGVTQTKLNWSFCSAVYSWDRTLSHVCTEETQYLISSISEQTQYLNLISSISEKTQYLYLISSFSEKTQYLNLISSISEQNQYLNHFSNHQIFFFCNWGTSEYIFKSLIYTNSDLRDCSIFTEIGRCIDLPFAYLMHQVQPFFESV